MDMQGIFEQYSKKKQRERSRPLWNSMQRYKKNLRYPLLTRCIQLYNCDKLNIINCCYGFLRKLWVSVTFCICPDDPPDWSGINRNGNNGLELQIVDSAFDEGEGKVDFGSLHSGSLRSFFFHLLLNGEYDAVVRYGA